MVLTILLTALALLATTFVVVLVRAAIKRRTDAPGPEAVILGAVVNFFDTLGIGSFASARARLSGHLQSRRASRVTGTSHPTL